MSTQNTVCWVDIPVLNLERAITFYSAILDTEVSKISEHGFEFGLLPHLNDNVSGCLCVIEGRKPSAEGPLIYLNVSGQIDEAIARVEQQGGKLLKGKEQMDLTAFVH